MDVPPFRGNFIARGQVMYCFVNSPGCNPYLDPDCAVKNVPVALEVYPVELSGSHYHAADNTRPTGFPARGQTYYGNTGSDGCQVVVTHEWPEVCGKLNILFRCTADTCAHACDRDTLAVLCIMDTLGNAAANGLTLLPDDTTLYLKNNTGQDQQVRHPYHLYGTPEMIDSIRAAAIEIRAKFPRNPHLLVVNDISLPWGGMFDLVDATHSRPPDWTPPHGGHRFGIEADFRDWNMGNRIGLRDSVRSIMRRHGLIPNTETGHIHVTLRSLSHNH
ncbi:MAG: hypothetical protein HZB25_10100 [Candidatus Eisenbacteria bacterium]|nr:hypothetical protein [Candidatus Eisenbacteria bacterium]